MYEIHQVDRSTLLTASRKSESSCLPCMRIARNVQQDELPITLSTNSTYICFVPTAIAGRQQDKSKHQTPRDKASDSQGAGRKHPQNKHGSVAHAKDRPQRRYSMLDGFSDFDGDDGSKSDDRVEERILGQGFF